MVFSYDALQIAKINSNVTFLPQEPGRYVLELC